MHCGKYGINITYSCDLKMELRKKLKGSRTADETTTHPRPAVSYTCSITARPKTVFVFVEWAHSTFSSACRSALQAGASCGENKPKLSCLLLKNKREKNRQKYLPMVHVAYFRLELKLKTPSLSINLYLSICLSL